MYKLVVGNISRKREENWFCRDENPYAVWEGGAIAEEICTGDVCAVAGRMLRHQVDIDWGSVAWKANKGELLRLFQTCGFDPIALDGLESEKDYAAVFIETVWGGSA